MDHTIDNIKIMSLFNTDVMGVSSQNDKSKMLATNRYVNFDILMLFQFTNNIPLLPFRLPVDVHFRLV